VPRAIALSLFHSLFEQGAVRLKRPCDDAQELRIKCAKVSEVTKAKP